MHIRDQVRERERERERREVWRRMIAEQPSIVLLVEKRERTASFCVKICHF